MVFNKTKKGFTVVELMIAISVFATTMVIVLAGVILISRQYQQSSNKIALEDAARNMHQQIADSIKFSNSDVVVNNTNATYNALCVGGDMYLFGKFSAPYGQNEYNNITPGLFLQKATDKCATVTMNADAANLLPNNAKVTKFTITNTEISTQFVKSDFDLLELGNQSVQCKIAISGREFCAVVSLDSTAIRRVGTN